jgi:hypothetical protein
MVGSLELLITFSLVFKILCLEFPKKNITWERWHQAQENDNEININYFNLFNTGVF